VTVLHSKGKVSQLLSKPWVTPLKSLGLPILHHQKCRNRGGLFKNLFSHFKSRKQKRTTASLQLTIIHELERSVFGVRLLITNLIYPVKKGYF